MSVGGILNSTLSALSTYMSAIDVISTNIGNVETPGYTRQLAVLQANAPINTGGGLMGTGVGVANVTRIYNAFLTTQLRMANEDMGKWTAEQESLSSVEQIFSNTSASGLASTMTAFWSNWQNLVNNPSGSTQRSLLVNSAVNLVKSFNDMSSQLADTQKWVDKNVVDNVSEVNSLVQKIAVLNQNIQQTQAAGQNTNSYKDELDLQVANLAKLINVNTYSENDGQVNIQLAGGKPLVERTSTWLLSTSTNAVTGLKDITWTNGGIASVVNNNITGGKLGGYLAVRDTMITDYQTQLDTLARSIITNVNSLHTAGFDIDGVAGVAFFTNADTGLPFVLPADANARNIAVNVAIYNPSTGISAPGLIAAASTAVGAPGNGSNAAAIAELQNHLNLALSQATFSNYFSALTSKVGIAVQATDANYSSQSSAINAWQNQRDSYSGVSVDEEQTKLILYQNAYSAAAKLIAVLNEMMKTLINL